MANMFDYLLWRGDLDFSRSPFNPVDNIILSQLSYLPLGGIVPGPDENRGIGVARAAEIFSHTTPDGVIFKDDPSFFDAVARTARFKDCELRGFVNSIDTEAEKQFSAISILTGKKSAFVAFRGTDATIVGWKEDFNMSFSDVIPAQTEAVSYLEKMAGLLRGTLSVGGHSKGGNLAVYAASFCREKTRRRIDAVYSNDAPGFRREVIESEGFCAIKDRVRSFVPRSSVIGMLFEHGVGYTVVDSSSSGLMQHDLYSWQVTHNDMARVDEITQESRFIDKTLRDWLASFPSAQRRQFVDALFSILGAAQVSSFPELTADWFKAAVRMIQSLGDIDEGTREVIGKTFAALFKAARRNIDTLLPH